MAVLVRIHVSGAIQAFPGFLEVGRAHVKIKELEQRLTIIVFTIGGIEELAEKLEHLGRGAVAAHQVLHHGDESAPLPAPPLEQFQLARKGHAFRILLRVDHLPD